MAEQLVHIITRLVSYVLLTSLSDRKSYHIGLVAGVHLPHILTRILFQQLVQGKSVLCRLEILQIRQSLVVIEKLELLFETHYSSHRHSPSQLISLLIYMESKSVLIC